MEIDIFNTRVTGVPAQVPHSRENSVPPTIQATHGTNISNVEVSYLYIYIILIAIKYFML